LLSHEKICDRFIVSGKEKQQAEVSTTTLPTISSRFSSSSSVNNHSFQRTMRKIKKKKEKMERKIQDQCLLLYSRRVIHYREKEKEKKKKNETRKRTSKLTNNP
jgi:hypothetical protein